MALIDPVKFYKDGSRQHGGVQAAKVYYYNDFTNKYFTPIVQESTVQQLLAFKHLIPGKIYTYQYSPIGAGTLDWYDTRPIIISIRHYKAESTSNPIEFGINLNFLPAQAKKIVLDRLYQTYRSLIDRNMRNIESGNILNQKPLFTDTHDFIKVLDYLWDSVGNTNYRFACRNYIFDRMKNIKAVDYSDWGQILFLESRDITGASIGQIYKEYYDSKHKKTKQKKKKT